MRGINTDRLRVAMGAALCGAIAAGVLACASSSAPPSDAEVGGSSQVMDVLVESFTHGSTVTVVGPEAPVFTAFQQEEPDRVVVEMADVEPGDLEGAIPVHDGTIQEVRIETAAGEGAETLTRVEVWLSSAADYDVRGEAGGLVIEVNPLTAMGTIDDAGETGDGELADDPWAVASEEDAGALDEAMAEDVDDSSAAWDVEDADEAGTPAEVVPAPAATVLSGIEAREVGEGSLVHLKGDGTVESAVTFTLENPDRLVVDLPEMKNEVAAARTDVGSAHVSRVRLGEHEDKVRVVIDAGSASSPFEGRQVTPVPTGLVIALGSSPALEEAVAAIAGSAPERVAEAPAPSAGEGTGVDPAGEAEPWPADDATPAAEPVADTGQVTIYGVEFDPQDERDRVVVLGEEPVDYLVYEPDPDTVVLSIADAVIAPEAAVRIAPEQDGAVSLVTAFEQPDVKRPEVRVVVKRAPNLKPEVSRRGSLLIVDFPRTGALASKPPVFQADGQPLGESPEGEPLLAGTDPAGAPAGAAPGTQPVPGAPSPMDAEPGMAMDSTGLPMADVPADPASGEPPAAIEILNEGGLMDGKEYVGRRISLDFKEVDIADVLRLIAEVSDLNVIAGDEVKGKVTIRLVEVPWDQALDVILLTKGLGFARVGNVLRIASSDVLAQEEEMRLQERRAKEKLEDLVVKLQPVNYADVKDVSKMVKELLTPRGSVNTDSRTNTLIIKDIASVIDEATALVKAVDTMTPQVMIEAKIVEASLDFSRELGSLWTFGTNPATENTLGGRDYVFQQGDDDGIADGFGNEVVFGNPITAGPTGVLGLAASVLDERFNFEIELQAAEVNGDGKVISSPRIVTLDNSTASIEQGVSIPFQTFENGDAQLEFVDAVLKLDVTPHITSDRSIIMEIEVSRNAPDDSVFTLTGSPAIAKNQVETETLVKDGQTLVLGGIYVVDRSERQSRVPFLNRLPFLGNLFKSDEFSDSRKELLVFVSPRIVQTPGADDAI